MRRTFVFCFKEITLKTLRKDARIFGRNFSENSQRQRTKFAHFALITFAQYCIMKAQFFNMATLRVTLFCRCVGKGKCYSEKYQTPQSSEWHSSKINVKIVLNVVKKLFKFPWKFCLCPYAWVNQNNYQILATLYLSNRMVSTKKPNLHWWTNDNYTKTIICLRLVNIGEYSPWLRNYLLFWYFLRWEFIACTQCFHSVASSSLG